MPYTTLGRTTTARRQAASTACSPSCLLRPYMQSEQAVLAACRRAVVVRPSVVYGIERQQKNFVYQLLRAAQEGKGFRLAVDQKASPSYNPDVAAASVELA